MSKNQTFLAALCILFCAACLYAVAAPPTITGSLPLVKAKGFAYQHEIPELSFIQQLLYKNRGDGSNTTVLTVFENGRPLPYRNAAYVNIRNLGNGRYLHKENKIFFSLLDNNTPDPRALSHTYALKLEPRPWLIFITLAAGLASIFLVCSCINPLVAQQLWRAFICAPKAPPKSRRIQIACLAICFISVFSASLKQQGDFSSWKFAPDTPGYWVYNYLQPWQGVRSPGYPLFLDAIQQRKPLSTFFLANKKPILEQLREERGFILAQDVLADNHMQRVVVAQALLLAFSLGVLALALTKFMPIILSTAAPLFAMNLSMLPPPQDMLADPLAAVCSILFCALALFFLNSGEIRRAALMCVVAVFGFLVKPAMIILAIIAGITIGVRMVQSLSLKIKLLKLSAIGAGLTLGILAFPLQLYFTGGIFTTGQLGATVKIMRALSVAVPEDIQYMPTLESRAVLAKTFEIKQNLLAQDTKWTASNGHSPAYTYNGLINFYGFKLYPKSVAEALPGQQLTILDNYRLMDKIAKPILTAHKLECLGIMLHSFIGAFGAYDDFIVAPFLKHFDNKKILRYLYPFLYIFILITLLKSRQSLRMPIFVTFSIHFLHIITSSIASHVMLRYLQITEWSLFVSFILALYSIWLHKFAPICANLNLKLLPK